MYMGSKLKNNNGDYYERKRRQDIHRSDRERSGS